MRSEKKKQLSSVEQKGADNLQKWQARKLLDLHNQYQDCLKDIGLAHREAELITNEESILRPSVEQETKKAKEKPRQKTTKTSDTKKGEINPKRQSSIYKEKPVKAIENVKSGMTSKICKKKSSPFKRKKIRKKVITNITANDVLSESEDSENDVPYITVNDSQESTKSNSTTNTANSKDDQYKLPATTSEEYCSLPEIPRSANRSTVINIKESKINHGKADSALGKVPFLLFVNAF